MAYQLLGDEKVQAAIAEVSQQRLTVLGPLAVHALEKLLGNPAHRDHGRALGIVFDRVAPALSQSVVKVEGEVKVQHDSSFVMARIEGLCAKFAIPLPPPKTIEHEEAA